MTNDTVSLGERVLDAIILLGIALVRSAIADEIEAAKKVCPFHDELSRDGRAYDFGRWSGMSEAADLARGPVPVTPKEAQK